MSENSLARIRERYLALYRQIDEMKVRERELKMDWVQRTGQDVPVPHRYPMPRELIELQQRINGLQQEILHRGPKLMRVAKFVAALRG